MLWNIWLGMIIIGISLLILSTILTFVFKVPDLLDELSGRKEKRQIKRLRDLNLGTGSLEAAATEDVYQVMSSGALLSDELNIEAINLPKKESLRENIVIEEDVVGNDEDSTTYQDNSQGEESATTMIDTSEVNTGYVEEGESTSYIDSSDVTNILSDIEKYNVSKHIVEVVEEQSSI